MMRCASSMVMIASAAIARIPANFASDARSSSSLRQRSARSSVMSVRLCRSAPGWRVCRPEDPDLQREVHVLGAMGDPQLFVDALLVCIDGLRADEQLLADLRRRVTCLLYTSDAADERSSVDLGGRR